MNREEGATDQENFNNLTIAAYNSYALSYVDQTSTQYDGSRRSLQDWIDTILDHVKPAGSILEVGSATPRDALYMRSKGFTVQCTDGTPNFVDYLNDNGEEAFVLDITKQPIPEKTYDLVFANAVFPHFTNEDVKRALGFVYEGLTTNGIIAFNVKQGDSDEWIDEKFKGQRYINYWQPHDIYDIVREIGFDVIRLDDGIEGERPTHIWTRVIAQKL